MHVVGPMGDKNLPRAGLIDHVCCQGNHAPTTPGPGRWCPAPSRTLGGQTQISPIYEERKVRLKGMWYPLKYGAGPLFKGG